MSKILETNCYEYAMRLQSFKPDNLKRILENPAAEIISNAVNRLLISG